MGARRRKSETVTERSLLDAWLRPEAAGAPIAALSSTFEFDSSFYERELLPRFLGCAHDSFDDELLFMLEREERLSAAYAAVLVDSANVSVGRTSARWDQLPITVDSGCFHSKISVLAWEKQVRLIVASANLTIGGYRTNHEIAWVLDFDDDATSPPRSVLFAFIDALERYVQSTLQEANASERYLRVVETVRSIVRKWKALPLEQAPRAATQLVPIFVEPPSVRRRGRTFYDGLSAAAGSLKFERCWVMSPFWDDPPAESAAPDDAACLGLRDFLRVRSARITVIARGGLSGPETAWVEAPARVRDTLATLVGADDVLAAPVVLEPGKHEGDRRLHAKGLWLYDSSHRLLVAGSSNFTTAGTGSHPHRWNVEANLAVLTRDDAPEYDVIDEIGPPNEDERQASSVDWKGAPKDSDGDGKPEACTPPFVVVATLDAETRELEMRLLSQPEPTMAWELSIPDTDGVMPALWSVIPESSAPEPTKSIKLPNLVWSLRLTWRHGARSGSAPIPVTVKDRAALPTADAMRALTVDELLAFLVSGLEPWEALRKLETKRSALGLPSDALDPHKLVDTSGYVTTRTRRFSHALAALRARLSRNCYATLDAVRSYLFGP